MKKSSFNEDIAFNDDKVAVKVIFETEVSKEIRILFKEGQQMKEHKTAFPITVHVLKGCIDFGVNGEKHKLAEGAIIALPGNVPHDLHATEESMVRLTLSKSDNIQRVVDVINK